KQFTVQVTDIASGATTGAVSTPVTITDKAPTVQIAPQDTLTVPEGSQATNSGTFIDFNEPMTITASQGTLTDNHDGQGVWTQTGEKSDSGTVTITATNTEGSSTPITFNVEFTDGALHAKSGPDQSGVEEGAQLGTQDNPLTLAVFTDDNANAPMSDYSATINWGDGTPVDTATFRNGILVLTPTDGVLVQCSHTYAESGSYHPTITINDVDGASATLSGEVAPTITVVEAPLTAQDLTPPSATEGQPVNDVVLLHFTDANPVGQISDYIATVTWG